MSGKQKFLPGDKVFAKVRGYPAWPARIEGSADETPNKMRYHVYFYGTGETGVVKADDIWTFVENKSRFGKPKKPKNFAEAMIQIEAELTPEQLKHLADLEAKEKEQSGVSNDSMDSDNARKSLVSKKSLSPTPKSKVKEKKRKLDIDSGTEENEKKKVSISVSDSDSSVKTPEVMSRSGRKIKPKRFADFEDDGMDENHLKANNMKVPFNKRDEEFLTAIVNNEKIEIPIYLNKPTFTDMKAEEEWKNEVYNQASQIKKRLEAGETLPMSPIDLMDKWTNDLRNSYNKNVVKPEVDVDRAEILQSEAHLLELDLSIRGALNIKSADTDKCITLLDKLKDLPVTALMLKKHPDVVQTIKKVRRYIGNVPRAYTEAEEQRFHKNAEIIRQKAEHIYMKFQSLFLVTGSRSFWEVFEEERERFDRDTKHLTTEEIVSMIDEP